MDRKGEYILKKFRKANKQQRERMYAVLTKEIAKLMEVTLEMEKILSEDEIGGK